MIVYNVAHLWFPMKNDAEAYRRSLGLKPDALFKLEIHQREELAALLNGLVGLKAPEAPAGAVLEPPPAPPEVLERSKIEVPSFIPDFLVKQWASREGIDMKDIARSD